MSLYLLSVHEGERYLIPSADVAEVTPYVMPRKITPVPEYVVGMIDYRGETLPLIDICLLLSGEPCKVVLCSRILIGMIKSPEGKTVKVGWLFDGVTETVRITEDRFKTAPLHLEQAPYLGDVATDEKGIMQRIIIQHILPDDAYAILFSPLD
ncbi:hypothetical protein MNBD_GAMMA18-159 [hydrothermal vent metagenome]|uniref:CheW-like domain-containing protein n=1 Tax=hydrothermal vent metagenome TaxID=652676 RepID=A0A3B0ZK17_9ZZZZ